MHDAQYAKGGTVARRLFYDRQLRWNIVALGDRPGGLRPRIAKRLYARTVAWLYYIAVRLFGSFFTSDRFHD